MTNHHVIDACKRVIWIDTTDGQEGTATVVASDPANDLALLKTNLKVPAIAIFRTPVETGSGGEISVIGYGTHKLPPLLFVRRACLLTDGFRVLPAGCQRTSGRTKF